MITRLQHRAGGNDYGRAGDTLRAALAGHTGFLAAWRRHGAVTVDATEPLETVGQEVLLAAATASLDHDPPYA